jgi:ferrous iron transport protein B
MPDQKRRGMSHGLMNKVTTAASCPPVDFTVVLAGNANVGKSATINQLTGSEQVTGNWPGKTVECAGGILQHDGYRIRIIDLPGIYSFSTYSAEEKISREFILNNHPDVVINIIDASALERNLFFTLQLAELNVPLIVVVNQTDLAAAKGIFVDTEALAELLGVAVVSTVAIHGKGMAALSDAIVATAKKKTLPRLIPYGREVEDRITQVTALLPPDPAPGPARWTAIRLLENDPDVIRLAGDRAPEAAAAARRFALELEIMHGEPSGIILSGERYQTAERIIRSVMEIRPPSAGDISVSDRIDRLALHPVAGYALIFLVIGGLLVWTFIIGSGISGYLTAILSSISPVHPFVAGSVTDILLSGAWTGLVAAATLIVPYVLPFYLFLSAIEDSGYLTRISMMLDQGMHRLGLHGKAIIPLILGYGCTVPACLSCRILETSKQKLLAAFMVTLIPCSARTIVILSVVATFVNIWWALALYVFNILLVIILGRIAFRAVDGESVGMIMEMPDYHVPSPSVVLAQTWARTKSLIWIVLPAYIIGGIAISGAYSAGLLDPINAALSPVTVTLLGLPAVTGVVFLFGIVRKEITILTLAALFGTTVFSSVLSPVQLIVFALVTMIYTPCISTIFVFITEFGWKKAAAVTASETALAIILGAVAYRLLSLFM